MREPAALFWGIAFPLLLTVIFGIATSSQKPDHKLGGMRVVDAYVPVMMAFVLTVLALQALPSALASYREKGVLRRMSTTPVPPSLLLGADVIVSATVIVFALAMIAVIARVAFNVALPTQAVGFAVARGATNREAAAQLFISEATIKTHLLHIYAKLGVGDRAAAVAEAFNRRLLTPEQPERPVGVVNRWTARCASAQSGTRRTRSRRARAGTRRSRA
jgi:hypothetical protein